MLKNTFIINYGNLCHAWHQCGTSITGHQCKCEILRTLKGHVISNVDREGMHCSRLVKYQGQFFTFKVTSNYTKGESL